jgi:nucleoside-diphosphate-sugar epimerase
MGFNVVTITGASGFVGRNIQDYLNVSYRIKPLFVTYLTKKLIWKGDAIIHLAGKPMIREKKVSN